jgi:hypothetical protein
VMICATGKWGMGPSFESISYYSDLCTSMELVQALHLFFRSAFVFKEVTFSVPSESLCDFAAVVVDSETLKWIAKEEHINAWHGWRPSGRWRIGQGRENVTVRQQLCHECGWELTCA